MCEYKVIFFTVRGKRSRDERSNPEGCYKVLSRYGYEKTTDF